MRQSFTDQMNQVVELESPPQRIISLVPSQTELLFYLGLEKEVVGITKFCVHPPEQFKSKPRIGGTKQFNFDKINLLQPDLIIGNKEENQKEQIEQLQQTYPVWMSDIKTLDDAYDMIIQIGKITQKETAAIQLVQEIKTAFLQLDMALKNTTPKTAAYLIWQNPYMVVAADTFINHLLQRAGFINVFQTNTRYPIVSAEDLGNATPEVLLLSSEPFPFKEKHITALQQICPHTVIKLVDGELFSWYGNRLLYAVSYFLNLQK